MLPLGAIFRIYNINYQSYIDDNQRTIDVTPDDYSPVDRLVLCLADIDTWMSDNFLKLNREKTEVLIIGNREEREKLSNHMKTLDFSPKDKARNLGVIIDSDLSFESHKECHQNRILSSEKHCQGTTVSLPGRRRKTGSCIYQQ